MEEEEAAQSQYVRRRPRIRTRRVADCRYLLPRLRDDSRSEEASADPLMELMKYAVPVVVPLLIFRYQPQPDDLFQKNPAPVCSFIAATAAYWLIAGAMNPTKKKNGDSYKGLRVALGVLSALSLLSMFLPHPLSLLPLFFFAVLLALFYAYTWIRPRVQTVIAKIINTQPQNLPV